jgi:hypothetical protein
MSRRALILGTLVVAVSLTLAIALTAIGASNCTFRDHGYDATVTTSVYNGPGPYPVCLTGVPIVQVAVTVTGHGTSGSSTQLRCGILNDAVVFTVHGDQHSIAPGDGFDWQDTLTDCDALTYTVN